MKPLTGDELAAIDAAVVLGNRIPKITTLRLVAEVCRLTEENASYADELLTCDREELRVYATRLEARLSAVEALAGEFASSGCIHLNTMWGRLRAALDGGAD